MCAPKYQCGPVKLDQLGAHMAPGVLKLFATLSWRNNTFEFKEMAVLALHSCKSQYSEKLLSSLTQKSEKN